MQRISKTLLYIVGCLVWSDSQWSQVVTPVLFQFYNFLSNQYSSIASFEMNKINTVRDLLT